MYGLRSTRTAETPYGASPTGSPPLPGYARLAWFPDGYRVSIFPYRSALRPNPASRAHRPRYSAFPTAVGGLLALEGPTLRVTTGKASNLSALAGRKPRAKILARPPLLPRPLGHHTPYCGRTAGPPGTGL